MGQRIPSGPADGNVCANRPDTKLQSACPVTPTSVLAIREASIQIGDRVGPESASMAHKTLSWPGKGVTPDPARLIFAERHRRWARLPTGPSSRAGTFLPAHVSLRKHRVVDVPRRFGGSASCSGESNRHSHRSASGRSEPLGLPQLPVAGRHRAPRIRRRREPVPGNAEAVAHTELQVLWCIALCVVVSRRRLRSLSPRAGEASRPLGVLRRRYRALERRSPSAGCSSSPA